MCGVGVDVRWNRMRRLEAVCAIPCRRTRRTEGVKE